MCKIHCHERKVRIKAATAGPATPITPQTVAFAAKARLTRAFGYTSDIAAVPVDRMSPAPAPCSTRRPINNSIEGANAAAKPAVANTVTAKRNIRDTPTASMNGPATTVARLEVTRNAVITHGRSDTLPRSAAISGRAAAMPNA